MKRTLLIVFSFLVLLSVVSVPILLPLAKMVRSQQHLMNAREAKAEEDHRMALFKLQSAHNLAPENPEILSKLGPYAAAVYSPYTLQYWTDAADRDLLELEDIVEMIEYGLRVGEGDRVRPYLFHVARANPEDPRVKALQVHFLRRDRRNDESRELAEELVRGGNLQMDVVSAYVQSTFSGQEADEAAQADALATLRELAEAEDERSLYALRVLIQLWDRLPEADKAHLATKVEQKGELPDRLNLLSRQKADGADAVAILAAGEAFYKEAVATGESDTGTASAAGLERMFTLWLSREGFHEAILAHLPEAGEIRDGDVYFFRQLALIETGAAAEARDLSFKESPLSPTRNLVIRALAHGALGQPDKVLPNLELAAENVLPREIGWLENVLRQFGSTDLVIGMYEDLERRLANPLPVQLRLLQYYYAFGREADVQRVAGAVSLDQFAGFLAEQMAALYFVSLYQTDRKSTRRHLEGMVNDYPNLIEPRVFLAFSYAMAGAGPEALRIIEGWESFQLQQDRLFAIMLAYIHARSGDLDTAVDIMGAIAPETLLDQERVLLSGLI
ncbi:MAG: hypothetical protein AB3N33_07865 [Puniceicoccaceae bacterium]